VKIGLLGGGEGIPGFAIESEFEDENGSGDSPLRKPGHINQGWECRRIQDAQQ
jgi:hypothetical protein